MKAISIIEANRCEFVEIPEPAAPAAGEVRLKVRQVGFCGSEDNAFGIERNAASARIICPEIVSTRILDRPSNKAIASRHIP